MGTWAVDFPVVHRNLFQETPHIVQIHSSKSQSLPLEENKIYYQIPLNWVPRIFYPCLLCFPLNATFILGHYKVENMAVGSLRPTCQLAYLGRIISLPLVQYIKPQGRSLQLMLSELHPYPSQGQDHFLCTCLLVSVTLHSQHLHLFVGGIALRQLKQLGLPTQIARSVWKNMSLAGSL